MNRTSLTRRLLAGAAGLMIGAAGAAALAAPAQATGDHETQSKPLILSDVEFVDICEGTYVYIKTGNVARVYEWWITAGGEEFWTGTLKPGETTDMAPPLVPSDAGEIKVGFQTTPDGWPKIYNWTEPDDCGEPEPTPTAEPTPEPTPTAPEPTPTPTAPGPEEPPGEVEYTFDCETITLILTNFTEEDITLEVAPSGGDSLEVTVGGGESSEPVSFDSAEGLVIDLLFEGVSVLDDPIEITSEEWAEAGCDAEGEGGELPTTGASTGLIAGGAVLLLAIGGGLFLVARRRRVTFTA